MLIGIDLGTTNSALAIWRDGTAQLVPRALGEPQKPSPVNFKRLMGHGAMPGWQASTILPKTFPP